MSTASRARRFEFEGAQRRVAEQLKIGPPPASSARRAAVLAGAAGLFALTFAARLAIDDPDALIANFYIIPIALLAIEFGTLAGFVAALAALGLVLAWSLIETVHVGVLGYTSRMAALLVTGVVVGRFSERLRADIAARRQAQRRLSLYADELERTNHDLAHSVEQLEAFAEIARTLGGETDLSRVLSLILTQGKEIVGARELTVYLPQGDSLTAVREHPGAAGSEPPLPVTGSLAGEVLSSGRSRRVSDDEGQRPRLEQLAPGASAAMLVPLRFRGEVLGVLAAIEAGAGRTFGVEDEELLGSVAASAATAIATARSVAAARLRLSLEAAEGARARWARELHDETLQGLSGVRMLLSAGLAREDFEALGRAAERADAHLEEEIRKLRDLIAELRPAALDDLGLGPAIESLANRQAAIGGFSVEVGLRLEHERRLAPEIETVIYRIVQEALTNVLKHAGARHVALAVTQRPDAVELSVTDDGRGFDPARATEGFGLAGMRERALLAGGRLTLSSEPGATCVCAVMPL